MSELILQEGFHFSSRVVVVVQAPGVKECVILIGEQPLSGSEKKLREALVPFMPLGDSEEDGLKKRCSCPAIEAVHGLRLHWPELEEVSQENEANTSSHHADFVDEHELNVQELPLEGIENRGGGEEEEDI